MHQSSLPIIETIAISTHDGWCTPYGQWSRSLKQPWSTTCPSSGIVDHASWYAIDSVGWKVDISGGLWARLRLQRWIILAHSQQCTVMHLISIHCSHSRNFGISGAILTTFNFNPFSVFPSFPFASFLRFIFHSVTLKFSRASIYVAHCIHCSKLLLHSIHSKVWNEDIRFKI